MHYFVFVQNIVVHGCEVEGKSSMIFELFQLLPKRKQKVQSTFAFSPLRSDTVSVLS